MELNIQTAEPALKEASHCKDLSSEYTLLPGVVENSFR